MAGTSPMRYDTPTNAAHSTELPNNWRLYYGLGPVTGLQGKREETGPADAGFSCLYHPYKQSGDTTPCDHKGSNTDHGSSAISYPTPILTPLALIVLSPAPDRTNMEEYLRYMFDVPRGAPLNLWTIPEPGNGGIPTETVDGGMCTLLKLAIYGSPGKRLTVKAIFNSLIERFAWFDEHREDKRWKNSVRNTLSQYREFKKIGKRGKLWALDLSRGEGRNEEIDTRRKYRRKLQRDTRT